MKQNMRKQKLRKTLKQFVVGKFVEKKSSESTSVPQRSSLGATQGQTNDFSKVRYIKKSRQLLAGFFYKKRNLFFAFF